MASGDVYDCVYSTEFLQAAGRTASALWYFTGAFVDGKGQTILCFHVDVDDQQGLDRVGRSRSVKINMGSEPKWPHRVEERSSVGFTIFGFAGNDMNGLKVYKQ